MEDRSFLGLSSAMFNQEHIRGMLRHIGENPDRQGLEGTPERYLKAWKFWTSGYGWDGDIANLLTSFEDGAERYDEVVFLGSIPVWSMCEHHLAPFFGHVHIGYLPKNKVVGLSKLPRLVEVFARRLQVQERLTQQIAETLFRALEPRGVGVTMRCRHSCMESRGIQRAGIHTTTQCLLGDMRESATLRSEFLALVATEEGKR